MCIWFGFILATFLLGWIGFIGLCFILLYLFFTSFSSVMKWSTWNHLYNQPSSWMDCHNHGTQRIIPKDSGFPVTCPLVPTEGYSCSFNWNVLTIILNGLAWNLLQILMFLNCNNFGFHLMTSGKILNLFNTLVYYHIFSKIMTFKLASAILWVLAHFNVLLTVISKC